MRRWGTEEVWPGALSHAPPPVSEGFFYLRSAEAPWAFAQGARYEGVLTFCVDWR